MRGETQVYYDPIHCSFILVTPLFFSYPCCYEYDYGDGGLLSRLFHCPEFFGYAYIGEL